MSRIRNIDFQHHLIKLQLQVSKNETIFSNIANRFDKTTSFCKKEIGTNTEQLEKFFSNSVGYGT